MTNYEWLVKQDLLGKFLEDFKRIEVSTTDMDNLYGHIHLASGRSYSEDVAAWLQEEHKESNVYVKLEDVINTIRDMKIPTADCIYRIRKLPIKIIKEMIEIDKQRKVDRATNRKKR